MFFFMRASFFASTNDDNSIIHALSIPAKGFPSQFDPIIYIILSMVLQVPVLLQVLSHPHLLNNLLLFPLVLHLLQEGQCVPASHLHISKASIAPHSLPPIQLSPLGQHVTPTMQGIHYPTMIQLQIYHPLVPLCFSCFIPLLLNKM